MSQKPSWVDLVNVPLLASHRSISQPCLAAPEALTDASESDQTIASAVATSAPDVAHVEPASPVYFDPSFEDKPVASSTTKSNARAGTSLNMRASDLHLSNEELIAVMSKVNQPRLSAAIVGFGVGIRVV